MVKLASPQETNTSPQPQTMEERLQPWIDQGETILLLVFVVMLWAGGWVNLLGYITALPFPNLRSFVVLAGFGLYTLGFIPLIGSIISLTSLERLKQAVAFVQRTPVIFFGMLAAYTGLVWSMTYFQSWRSLPVLQIVLLLLMLITTLVILTIKPLPDAPFQAWRKVALALLAGIIGLEIVLQLATFAGILPIKADAGLRTPYGRIYHTGDGGQSSAINAVTNRYGWYYADFRLEEGSHRIVLNGDTFVQALEIPVEDHMGQHLETLIDDDNTEVMAQGQMGYGASQFMNPLLHSYIWEPLQPNEMIVFFHLVNDFQVSDVSSGELPVMEINPDGEPVVIEEDLTQWHTLAHIVVEGHDPPNPIRTINSHLMTVQLAQDLLGIESLDPTIQSNLEQVSEEAPFGPAAFLYVEDGSSEATQAIDLAIAQITAYADFMAAQGVEIRLVTIPYFPDAFYQSDEARTTLDGYDLLQPEQALQAAMMENDIPFLGMGQHIVNTRSDAQAIQSLYFDAGRGHLTPEGHRYFAQAIYDCFYNANLDTAQAGCNITSESQD